MSLLGLGEYGASDSDNSTPASQKLGESPAPQMPAASGANEQLALKKSFSIVGYEDGGADEGDKGTPKAAEAEKPPLAADEPTANDDEEYANMSVDPDLLARCQKLASTTKTINFNNHLRRSHAFRNPEILPKLVEQSELDQFGSCYPEDVYNPNGYDQSMFFEQIYREQNRMLAARQAKAKKEKEKGKPVVTKITAGVPLNRQTSTDSRGSAGFGTRTEGEPTKKKSKWDNRASSGNALADFSKLSKK